MFRCRGVLSSFYIIQCSHPLNGICCPKPPSAHLSAMVLPSPMHFWHCQRPTCACVHQWRNEDLLRVRPVQMRARAIVKPTLKQRRRQRFVASPEGIRMNLCMCMLRPVPLGDCTPFRSFCRCCDSSGFVVFVFSLSAWGKCAQPKMDAGPFAGAVDSKSNALYVRFFPLQVRRWIS